MKKIVNIFKINVDKNRIYGLDVLRAFAVFVVAFGHSGAIFSTGFEKMNFLFLPDGVAIFFVLSGFLIGGIIIKTLEKKRPSFKALTHFWIRRWCRTLPLYFFILVLLLFLSHLFIPQFSIWHHSSFFLFCQNLYSGDPTFFSVSWSLSVEEWFYLLVPFIIFTLVGFFNVKPKWAILNTVIVVIVLTIAYRYYRYLTINVKSIEIFDSMFRRPVLTRLDSLMFGVAGAFVFYYYKWVWIKYKNAFFVAGLTLHILLKVVINMFFINSALFFCNFSFVLESTATLLLLPFFSQLITAKGIFYKIITYVSLISYSIYLLHTQIVLEWILRPIVYVPGVHNIAFALLKYLLFWLITICLSILTYKFIEIPFMKLPNGFNRISKQSLKQSLNPG